MRWAASPAFTPRAIAGEDATDAANNQLLLARLADKSAATARFVCVIALAERARCGQAFAATVEGEILHAPAEPGGFGYDPLFYYLPLVVFGEVDDEEVRRQPSGQALCARC